METEFAEPPFEHSIAHKLYIGPALMLLVLPFVNTINELLTSVVIRTGLYVFKGDSISSYTFQACHTIRVRVSIFATVDCTLQFSYDSTDKHSFIELPGIIVPEPILPMIFITPFVPILSVWIKRKNLGIRKEKRVFLRS